MTNLEKARERKRQEYLNAQAERARATIDYNVMMGNLEDPEETEGGDDE